MDELPVKILKNTDEEEYLDKLEDIRKSKPTICNHMYEVGVVVVNISSEYLHLVLWDLLAMVGLRLVWTLSSPSCL